MNLNLNHFLKYKVNKWFPSLYCVLSENMQWLPFECLQMHVKMIFLHFSLITLTKILSTCSLLLLKLSSIFLRNGLIIIKSVKISSVIVSVSYLMDRCIDIYETKWVYLYMCVLRLLYHVSHMAIKSNSFCIVQFA